MIEFPDLFANAEKYLFWKGRVGLYALLKGCGVGPGDEVILQSFTCVAVPNPIIYTGAKPVYVDIDPKTYTADIQQVISAISARTKVIILQNSFGHPPDYDRILGIAREKGICVIGDCAHGAGSKYKNLYDGFVADASIYSFQWTKPVSTGLGGCAIVKTPEAFPYLKDQLNELIVPAWRESTLLNLQKIVHDKFMTPKSYWMLVSVYRLLRKMGLQVSSSSKDETVGNVEPAFFFKGMAEKQERGVYEVINSLPEKVHNRCNAAKYYDSLCRKHGVEPAFSAAYAQHSYLRYPIAVRSNEKSFNAAREKKIQIGEWFRTPVDPGKNLTQWSYELGSCPRAEHACKTVINLPTDNKLSEKQFLNILN